MEQIYILLDKDVEECDSSEELKEWISFLNLERRDDVDKKGKMLIFPKGKPVFKYAPINDAVDIMAGLVCEKKAGVPPEAGKLHERTVAKKASIEEGETEENKQSTTTDSEHKAAGAEKEEKKSSEERLEALQEQLEDYERLIVKMFNGTHKRLRF